MSEQSRTATTDDGGDAAMERELGGLIRWMDDYLDAAVTEPYRDQPLAQDWARVAKVSEEVGESIDALIGVTGQNPRKGYYGTDADLFAEMCDVALTGLYGLQHFTKDDGRTLALLMERARYHRERVENPPPPSGAKLIAAERERQVDAEGWTPEHDDKHTHVELSSAAACYVDAARSQIAGFEVRHPLSRWPWHGDWWKPSEDPIRNLVKAGALIAAEIDRLQRAASGQPIAVDEPDASGSSGGAS